MQDLDNRMYCALEEGKKIAMPRYYKDKIYDEHQRKRIAYFAKQKAVKDDRHDMENAVGKHSPLRHIRDKDAFDRMYFQASKRDNL